MDKHYPVREEITLTIDTLRVWRAKKVWGQIEATNFCAKGGSRRYRAECVLAKGAVPLPRLNFGKFWNPVQNRGT